MATCALCTEEWRKTEGHHSEARVRGPKSTSSAFVFSASLVPSDEARGDKHEGRRLGQGERVRRCHLGLLRGAYAWPCRSSEHPDGVVSASMADSGGRPQHGA